MRQSPARRILPTAPQPAGAHPLHPAGLAPAERHVGLARVPPACPWLLPLPRPCILQDLHRQNAMSAWRASRRRARGSCRCPAPASCRTCTSTTLCQLGARPAGVPVAPGPRTVRVRARPAGRAAVATPANPFRHATNEHNVPRVQILQERALRRAASGRRRATSAPASHERPAAGPVCHPATPCPGGKPHVPAASPCKRDWRRRAPAASPRAGRTAGSPPRRMRHLCARAPGFGCRSA